MAPVCMAPLPSRLLRLKPGAGYDVSVSISKLNLDVNAAAHRLATIDVIAVRIIHNTAMISICAKPFRVH